MASAAVPSTALSDFQGVIKTWEDSRANEDFDPTSILIKLSELLEKEHYQYAVSDPDPFEDRHPYRVDPECKLGQLLKQFFKKESLSTDLFNNYLHESYWSRLRIQKNVFDLNVAATRLVLAILPGLQSTIFTDTEGLVPRLYTWAETAEEPLRSYATGLLGVASQLSEVASDPENREKNGRLIPLLLRRLKELQKNIEKPVESGEEAFKRPFSMFAKKKSPKTKSSENEFAPSLNPGWPCPIETGSVSENWSNSSWAEMESRVICYFNVYPLTPSAQQVFILRLLAPLAEYQDFLSFTVDSGILETISNYLNVKETKNTRLAFEALRFQAGLFCHKRIVMEWVATGGIQKLLDIPRPSIASTAASQVLYYICCDDDCMEKVCSLSNVVLNDLITYILWLVECSHESGKQFAIMFLYLSFSFRVLLDIFDEKDGMRILYNTINTLSILNKTDNEVPIPDDQEYMQKQNIRQVMIAFKKYTEAHLMIKADQLRRCNGDISTVPSHSIYKSNRPSQEQITERIDTLVEYLPFRTRWTPLDKFVQLGGITTCLKVLAVAYDWSCAGRSETVRSTLDCLAVSVVLPKVQLQLCERIELPDETKTVGFHIILMASEGEIVQDSSDIQKAALTVLINCLCAPVNNRFNSSSSILVPSKKKSSFKSSEEVLKKVWDCVRTQYGIMTLLGLLHTKTPITDADAIRALACKALTGLARSPAAQQIMSKLPIFMNGELQQLVREPILLDKRGEHVKFQQYAHELLELVSGPAGPRHLTGSNDFSLEMLHRASVVAQTKIRFSKKQLLQLIQEYLSSQGLSESASMLQKEANLALLTTKSLHHNCQTPLIGSRSLPRLPNSPSRSLSNPGISTPGTPATPNVIKLNKSVRRFDSSSSPSSSLNISQNGITPTGPSRRLGTGFDSDKDNSYHFGSDGSKNSLVSIISDYLSTQHSLCKNPMSTCPEFDLFLPHKCPDPRPRMSAPYNFTTRYMMRSIFAPYGGPDGRKLDLKLMYSRFRPVKTLRSNSESDSRMDNSFTTVAVTPDDQYILAGTHLGQIRKYNTLTGEEEDQYNCHESMIQHIQPSRNGELLLTSSAWRIPYSTLWRFKEPLEEQMVFNEEDYVEFSNLTQDKVVATYNEMATIYDITKSTTIRSLKSQSSNNYLRNRATFDPSDELVLNDGVLYDLRMSKEVRTLDKLNQYISGVFHPNGLEIVSNTEVWDIRTFQLLKSVPQLDLCQLTFTSSGDIIYGRMIEQDNEDGESKYESSFKTIDASDYSSIATIETRRSVLELTTFSNDLQLAVVENMPTFATEESVIRLYDVGRLRADQENYDEDKDEDGDVSDESNELDELIERSSDSTYDGEPYLQDFEGFDEELNADDEVDIDDDDEEDDEEDEIMWPALDDEESME